VIHPVEQGSPARAARIQHGGNEAQRRSLDPEPAGRWTFHEAVIFVIGW
jgi:hypothetical protein